MVKQADCRLRRYCQDVMACCPNPEGLQPPSCPLAWHPLCQCEA